MACIFPDGATLCLHRDLEATLDSLGRECADDAAAWKMLFDLYKKLAPDIVTLFSSPLPSVSVMTALGGARMKLGAERSLELARMAIMSPRAFATRFFRSGKVQSWFASWAGHSDHSPDTAGGGFLTWVIMGASQDRESGLAVPEGGSGQLTLALASLVRSLGGEIHTGARVNRVIVDNKTAKGVELADGTRVEAHRAIIAGVTPTSLFGDLVDEEHLPTILLDQVRRYRYGLSVLKIDLALDRPPEWKAGQPAGQAGLVHLSCTMNGMARAYAQATEGLLPAEPFTIVGQPVIADPSRAPRGKATLWVIASTTPYEVLGDAAGKLAARPWKHLKERYADRVVDTIDGYAPGLKQTILARRVMSPEDIQEMNPNHVGGDISAGSIHLDQFFMFRPVPNCSRYATPIGRLYLTGASTHPGSGVSGFSGYIVAKMLLS
jgi:phytoene dehydrogenase-like protein